jgi:hypothetical protein
MCWANAGCSTGLGLLLVVLPTVAELGLGTQESSQWRSKYVAAPTANTLEQIIAKSKEGYAELLQERQKLNWRTRCPVDIPVDIPVYVISHSGAVGRRDRLENEFDIEGIQDKTWIPGVRLNSSECEQIKAESKSMGVSATCAQLSAAFAHLHASRQLALDGHPAGLIIEEDASFTLSHRWPFSIAQITQILPATWTSLQLGYTRREVASMKHAPLRDVYIRKRVPEQEWGTVGYLLSRRGATLLMGLSGNATCMPTFDTGSGGGRIKPVSEGVMFQFEGSQDLVVEPRMLFAYNVDVPSLVGPAGDKLDETNETVDPLHKLVHSMILDSTNTMAEIKSLSNASVVVDRDNALGLGTISSVEGAGICKALGKTPSARRLTTSHRQLKASRIDINRIDGTHPSAGASKEIKRAEGVPIAAPTPSVRASPSAVQRELWKDLADLNSMHRQGLLDVSEHEAAKRKAIGVYFKKIGAY